MSFADAALPPDTNNFSVGVGSRQLCTVLHTKRAFHTVEQVCCKVNGKKDPDAWTLEEKRAWSKKLAGNSDKIEAEFQKLYALSSNQTGQVTILTMDKSADDFMLAWTFDHIFQFSDANVAAADQAIKHSMKTLPHMRDMHWWTTLESLQRKLAEAKQKRDNDKAAIKQSVANLKTFLHTGDAQVDASTIRLIY